jgi:SPP1 family predicted phage head-tail adaptor
MNLRHYIDPGEMCYRITVQTASASSVDDYGDYDGAWYNLAELWAKMEWKTGEEKMDAEQLTAWRGVEFTIRYRGDITEKMRILWEGDYYDIESIAQVGGRKRFELIRTKRYDSNQ